MALENLLRVHQDSFVAELEVKLQRRQVASYGAWLGGGGWSGYRPSDEQLGKWLPSPAACSSSAASSSSPMTAGQGCRFQPQAPAVLHTGGRRHQCVPPPSWNGGREEWREESHSIKPPPPSHLSLKLYIQLRNYRMSQMTFTSDPSAVFFPVPAVHYDRGV